MWIWEHADKIGHLSEAALAIFAMCTVVFAYVQISAARASQREATAMVSYKDYLLLSFRYPEYANPKKKVITENKYRWFVSVLLNACDEILNSVPKDPDWKCIVAAELEYHAPYLNSRYFLDSNEDRGWKLYSPELKNIFDHRDSFLVSP